MRAAALYDRVARVLPPRLAGSLDLTRPGFLASWGGPLNGQQQRQRMVRELARVVDFDQVVETGTFRGASTEFFAHVTGAAVRTVESSRRNYELARRRFTGLSNVEVSHGDSRPFLRALAQDTADLTSLFYLDAHWQLELPLRDELEVIASAWSRAVVLVDDFEVPGDAGYSYDDYGPGRKLTAAYLPRLASWRAFYPAAPSSSETGARRGCVVLVSPPLVATVSTLASLRPAPETP